MLPVRVASSIPFPSPETNAEAFPSRFWLAFYAGDCPYTPVTPFRSGQRRGKGLTVSYRATGFDSHQRQGEITQ
jgi:hypothetical protein